MRLDVDWASSGIQSEQMLAKVGISGKPKTRPLETDAVVRTPTFSLMVHFQTQTRPPHLTSGVLFAEATTSPVSPVSEPSRAEPSRSQLSSALRCLVSAAETPSLRTNACGELPPLPKTTSIAGPDNTHTCAHTRNGWLKKGHTQAQDTGSARQSARVDATAQIPESK